MSTFFFASEYVCVYMCFQQLFFFSSHSREKKPTRHDIHIKCGFAQTLRYQGGKLKEVRLKHNSFILRSSVFSSILSGRWLSHAGLLLADDMHYNFHSWKYAAVPCTKTEKRVQGEKKEKTLEHECVWLFNTCCVHFLCLPIVLKIASNSFPAWCNQCGNNTIGSPWNADPVCVCLCFTQAVCLLSYWLPYPMLMWESTLEMEPAV